MSQSNPKLVVNIENADTGWKILYTIGGIGALMAVLAFLLDLFISFGGEDFNPAALSAIEWFSLFQGNGLAGLRDLGFLNLISLTLSIALYIALYAAQRQNHQTSTALALVLFLVGATIYISNNAAIPMFVLSEKYAAAATQAQRTLLAAAGEAILARGADFTPGSFTGFVFTEIAALAFSLIMLRSRIFGRVAAWVGILGFTFLSIFTIWTTFIPVFFDAAMIFALVGGPASVVWYILVARGLFRLGKSIKTAEPSRKTLFAAG